MTPTAGPALGPLHSPSLRDRDRAEARARRNPLVWLREILMIIVVALVISSLLRAFIVQVFWIPSPSMHNTLVEDDRIAVSRIDALRSNVHRGDVVVFDDTLGWLGSSQSTSSSVLRRLGENRSNSADSRYHMGSGQSPYVPVSSVVGTVQAVIWPTSRWTTDIAHHEVFASVPDAS